MRKISLFNTLAKSSFLWTSTMARQTMMDEFHSRVSQRRPTIHILGAETRLEGTIRKEETPQCPRPDPPVDQGQTEGIPEEEGAKLRTIAGLVRRAPIKAKSKPKEVAGLQPLETRLVSSVLLMIDRATNLLRIFPMTKPTKMKMSTFQIP